MTELADQAIDNDLVRSGMLAEAVRRKAQGEVEFEGAIFEINLQIFYERNTRKDGEYYVVESTSRIKGQHETHSSSFITRSRDQAEEKYEELVEKYDLEAEEGDDPEAPEDEREPFGLMDRLKARFGSSSDSDDGESNTSETSEVESARNGARVSEVPGEDPREE